MIISCLSKMEIIVEQKYDRKDDLHIVIIFHKVATWKIAILEHVRISILLLSIPENLVYGNVNNSYQYVISGSPVLCVLPCFNQIH